MLPQPPAAPVPHPVQVAEIEDGQQEEDSAALINGQRALSIDIVKAHGENTIAVLDVVRNAVAEVQGLLPAGVQVEIVRDASTGIRKFSPPIFQALRSILPHGA